MSEAEVQVGDVVQYVPHEGHAFDQDRNGNYPWVFGHRRMGRAGKEEVIEVHGRDLEALLDLVRRHPDPSQARQHLVLLRPAVTWPAVVRAVNDDGSVALDITSPQGGVTLHYDRVRLGLPSHPYSHHTCHAGGSSHDAGQ